LKHPKKIEELEDKLFQMDHNYEGETAEFQKEYEEQKKLEVVESITDLVYYRTYKLQYACIW
jgi:hypothetical protein